MAYLSESSLRELGFKSLGKNVKISDKASIYNPELISIGNYSRIDDFCILSGNIQLGEYCHITPQCLIAGGVPGVFIEDFCTLAYGVKVFAQSDDYSGKSMVNSLIPKKYKNELFAKVCISRQVIIGAGAVIFPGVIIGEGCAVGAMSLVLNNLDEWGVYVGIPVRRLRDRSKELLNIENEFMRGRS